MADSWNPSLESTPADGTGARREIRRRIPVPIAPTESTFRQDDEGTDTEERP